MEHCLIQLISFSRDSNSSTDSVHNLIRFTDWLCMLPLCQYAIFETLQRTSASTGYDYFLGLSRLMQIDIIDE